MRNRVLRASLRTALILLAFAVVGTALLAYTHDLTRPIIARSEQAEKLRLITQALPASLYDNDILSDGIDLPPAPLLGTDGPTLAYRARKDGQPVAVVLEAVAPDGYSGKIRLLVAILADGRLAGVRVLAHNETPGLGDYIEIAKSKWIRVFENRSLGDPPVAQWKVKKDGGQFDYVAGATITPRAVVKAVRSALQYFSEHRDELFQTRNPSAGAGR